MKKIEILYCNKNKPVYIKMYILMYTKKIMRKKLKDKNIRKLYKHSASYAITLPKEIVDELDWRKGQKLVVKKREKGIYIGDWEK